MGNKLLRSELRSIPSGKFDHCFASSPQQAAGYSQSLNKWNLEWWHFVLLIILSSVVIVISAFLIRNFSQSSKQAPLVTKVPCPVPKEFCKTVVDINQGDVNKIGYKIPENTPILSVGKGVIRAGMSGGGKYQIPGHPLLFQENQDGKSFTYEFFGSYATPSASLVEAGTEIGRTTKTPEVWSNLYEVDLIIGAEQNRKGTPLKSEYIEQ